MTTILTPASGRRRYDRVHGGPPGTLRTAAALQLSNVDTNRALSRLEGRAVPYSAWTLRGWYHLSIAPGAFDKSIRESAAALPLLLFHDMSTFPVGTATEWRSEADGLYGVWRLDESAEAQHAARLARDGFLTGLSVGWMPMVSDWEIADPAEWNPNDAATFDRQTLREGRLAEVSMVPVPQFPDAQVSLVAGRRHAEGRPNLDRWKSYRASLTS